MKTNIKPLVTQYIFLKKHIIIPLSIKGELITPCLFNFLRTDKTFPTCHFAFQLPCNIRANQKRRKKKKKVKNRM